MLNRFLKTCKVAGPPLSSIFLLYYFAVNVLKKPMVVCVFYGSVNWERISFFSEIMI